MLAISKELAEKCSSLPQLTDHQSRDMKRDIAKIQLGEKIHGNTENFAPLTGQQYVYLGQHLLMITSEMLSGSFDGKSL